MSLSLVKIYCVIGQNSGGGMANARRLVVNLLVMDSFEEHLAARLMVIIGGVS